MLDVVGTEAVIEPHSSVLTTHPRFGFDHVLTECGLRLLIRSFNRQLRHTAPNRQSRLALFSHSVIITGTFFDGPINVAAIAIIVRMMDLTFLQINLPFKLFYILRLFSSALEYTEDFLMEP